MEPELAKLLTASAVRERCTLIGELANQDKTRWFKLNPEKIAVCADLVAECCLRNYPDLNIPYHSRWRHFVIGDTDLWQFYCEEKLQGVDDVARTKTAIDLVFISVLLDAGAGSAWRYFDPVTNAELSRSEGLAAASIHLFFNHLARFDQDQGFYLNAQSLRSLSLDVLAKSFQHSDTNPLIGMEGRLRLLRGLGDALMLEKNHVLSRPGDLYDVLDAKIQDDALEASEILNEILDRFGSIWPGGLIHLGTNLGDAGYHHLIQTCDTSNEIVPFHKLSQWLSYSLIEPLQWKGINVMNLDNLTGLPEYRNGGLFIDTEVLAPRDHTLLSQRLAVDSEAVVEWRALTVYLLDQLAERTRQELNRDTAQLPLSSILQGGTWAAGREIAGKLRKDGSPPINLAIDGTVF